MRATPFTSFSSFFISFAIATELFEPKPEFLSVPTARCAIATSSSPWIIQAEVYKVMILVLLWFYASHVLLSCSAVYIVICVLIEVYEKKRNYTFVRDGGRQSWRRSRRPRARARGVELALEILVLVFAFLGFYDDNLRTFV